VGEGVEAPQGGYQRGREFRASVSGVVVRDGDDAVEGFRNPLLLGRGGVDARGALVNVALVEPHTPEVSRPADGHSPQYPVSIYRIAVHVVNHKP